MEKIFDRYKFDNAIKSQAIATATKDSACMDLSEYRRIAFFANISAMAATNTVVLQIKQAQDQAATGLKNVTNATCTVTANTNVKAASLTLATALAGETVVINGLTYTAHATTTTIANREFSIAGTDTQDAAELVTCINDATYGVPGVTASSSAGVVTLTQTLYGNVSITLVGDTNITAATLYADAYLEIESNMLDTNNGFTHAQIAATTNATINVAVDSIRDSERYTPTQYFGAYKTDVS